MSVPPIISIMLARPRSDMSGTPARASATGNPKNFWLPCATKRNATTILRTLLRYGAHRAGIGPLISSPPVPYLGKWRAEKDNDREPDPAAWAPRWRMAGAANLSREALLAHSPGRTGIVNVNVEPVPQRA